MNIGFIGLGIMGKPMAKNLLRAGHPLFVYNRSTQSVQELAAAGAAASSIAQICAQCSVIFTMLPDSPDVRSVVLEQLYPHLKGGQVLIDMSSIDPGVSREIGEKLAEKQVGMLDAPVSGGEPKAVDATLSFMVGGQDALFRQYAPLLKTMGRTVTYCGPLGAGNTVKLANQMIVAANIAAAAEGLMLARRNGVSPETVFHAVRGGLAGSAVMEAKVPMMLPTVLNAPKVPTVCPLSSRLSTEYFTREGVTVPSKNKGNTKITMQAANAAMMRKLLLTVKISSAEIPRIMYLPTTGIRAIQMAAIRILP